MFVASLDHFRPYQLSSLLFISLLGKTMVCSIASLHGIAESAVWYRSAGPAGKAVSVCCAGRCKDPHGLPSQGGAFLPQLQLLVFIHRERILSFEFYAVGLRVIAIHLFKGN